jgi:LPXTG-motif cell wall-anchored protein
VYPNEYLTTERQDATATQGFFLRNKLAKGTPTTPPATCVAGLCTEHPVAAWTVRKDSQPEDGAMIHVGGNIYYRVKVTNLGGQAITGVQISDDMTQTLAATVWDPTAPPAVTVPYGISYYTASGTHITGADIVWNAATGPKPVFSGDQTFDPDFPDGLPFPGGTWTFTTPSFDIPATIGGQKVGYAIVGYAVEGGQVASPSDPAQQYLANGTTPVAALSNAMWINTASAGPATIGGVQVAPSRCAAPVPPGDVADYYDCKTWHSLGDSYFHMWKKSANEGEGGSGANLTGSVFVLADTQADALAGVSSRWLCRVGYAVPNPSNPMSEPANQMGTLTGNVGLDIGKASATHQSIEEANRVRSAYNITNGLNSGDPGFRPQLEQCGLFFELQGPGLDDGQEPGSWRAMDVRGGDTVSGGTDPLPSWRTQSGGNNGIDASAGIHGTYWVAEMKSPVDHQLLATPFKLWVAPNSPTPAGLYPGHPQWYNYQGRLSLPYVGEGEAEPAVPPGAPPMGTTDDGLKLRQMCVDAWQLPSNNQPNCVMPTGWTMPIFDVKAPALPLTGGVMLGALTAGGAGLALLAFAGVLWWRRRQYRETAQH